MFLYLGGASSHNNVQRYLFLENFSSDPAMVSTYNGQPKTASLVLLASALAPMGIALILFFIMMLGFFAATRLERALSQVGYTAGVLAGASSMGVAATPWDLFLGAHLVLANALFG